MCFAIALCGGITPHDTQCRLADFCTLVLDSGQLVPCSGAEFGASFRALPQKQSTLIFPTDDSDGCGHGALTPGASDNATNAQSRIVVFERGRCSFAEKAKRALQDYHADAVIVVNNDAQHPDLHSTMKFNGPAKLREQLTRIPVAMVSASGGKLLGASKTAELGLQFIPQLFAAHANVSLRAPTPTQPEQQCARPIFQALPFEEVPAYHKLLLDQFLEAGIRQYAPVMPSNVYSNSDGICICAGGAKLLQNAYLNVRYLRDEAGCTLPVEIWYNGPEELVEPFASLLGELPDVVLRDINAYHQEWWLSVRINAASQQTPSCSFFFESCNGSTPLVPNGFQLKAFATLYSSFSRVLFLDADNTPIRDPSFLFDTLSMVSQAGYSAIFWPEFWPLIGTESLQYMFGAGSGVGIPPSSKRTQYHQMESGQLLIDKKQSWEALVLNAFVNSGKQRLAVECVHGVIFIVLSGRTCLHLNADVLQATEPLSFTSSCMETRICGSCRGTERGCSLCS